MRTRRHDSRPPDEDETPRTPVTEGIHLFVLSGFAVAQPVFDLIGQNPTFLVAHRAGTTEIVALAAGLLVIPSVVLVLIKQAAAAVSPRLGALAQDLAVSALLALLALPPLVRALQPRLRYVALLTAGLILLGAYLYKRTGWLRATLTWAVPAPLVFAALFLFATPVRGLILPGSVPTDSPLAESPTDVVLVVFDEFLLAGIVDPAGQINRVRYPNFGRLADISTWYPRTMTVHDNTRVAVTSILTGLLPEQDAVPTVQQYPNNLFTLLGRTHQIAAREIVTSLCPTDLCEDEGSSGVLWRDTLIAYLHIVIPPPLARRWLPPIDDRWSGFTQTPTLEQVREDTRELVQARTENEAMDQWLNDLRPGPKPGFFYLHTLVPHTPWRYLPSGQIYDNDFFGGIFFDSAGGTWRDGPEYTRQGLQRYMLQVGYVDRFMGRLIDRLQATGILDQSLLIVMADHGISFEGNASRRSVDLSLTAGEILPIPLFVRYPGQSEGAIDDRPAQTIDILPTIADILEAPLDWDLPGRSLSEQGFAPLEPRLVTADGEVTIESELWLEVLDMAKSNQDLFGDGSEPFDLYAMGPFRMLVGSPIRPEGGREPTSGLTATISGVGRFSDVDPEALVVPARVTGVLNGEAAGLDLALALDGTIASVGWPYYFPEEGEWRFSLFIPPALMASGCNEITLFVIEDPAGALSPIPLTDRVVCP